MAGKLTNKNFKMPKAVKRYMSTISDPHLRGVYKRMMIDATVSAANAKMRKNVERSADTAEE